LCHCTISFFYFFSNKTTILLPFYARFPFFIPKHITNAASLRFADIFLTHRFWYLSGETDSLLYFPTPATMWRNTRRIVWPDENCKIVRGKFKNKKDTHIVQVSCDFLSGFVFLILTIYAVYENWAHMKERNISLLVIGNSKNVWFYLFSYLLICLSGIYDIKEIASLRIISFRRLIKFDKRFAFDLSYQNFKKNETKTQKSKTVC
jgi:hypothetical protein